MPFIKTCKHISYIQLNNEDVPFEKYPTCQAVVGSHTLCKLPSTNYITIYKLNYTTFETSATKRQYYLHPFHVDKKIWKSIVETLNQSIFSRHTINANELLQQLKPYLNDDEEPSSTEYINYNSETSSEIITAPTARGLSLSEQKTLETILSCYITHKMYNLCITKKIEQSTNTPTKNTLVNGNFTAKIEDILATQHIRRVTTILNNFIGEISHYAPIHLNLISLSSSCKQSNSTPATAIPYEPSISPSFTPPTPSIPAITSSPSLSHSLEEQVTSMGSFLNSSLQPELFMDQFTPPSFIDYSLNQSSLAEQTDNSFAPTLQSLATQSVSTFLLKRRLPDTQTPLNQIPPPYTTILDDYEQMASCSNSRQPEALLETSSATLYPWQQPIQPTATLIETCPNSYVIYINTTYTANNLHEEILKLLLQNSVRNLCLKEEVIHYPYIKIQYKGDSSAWAVERMSNKITMGLVHIQESVWKTIHTIIENAQMEPSHNFYRSILKLLLLLNDHTFEIILDEGKNITAQDIADHVNSCYEQANKMLENWKIFLGTFVIREVLHAFQCKPEEHTQLKKPAHAKSKSASDEIHQVNIINQLHLINKRHIVNITSQMLQAKVELINITASQIINYPDEPILKDKIRCDLILTATSIEFGQSSRLVRDDQLKAKEITFCQFPHKYQCIIKNRKISDQYKALERLLKEADESCSVVKENFQIKHAYCTNLTWKEKDGGIENESKWEIVLVHVHANSLKVLDKIDTTLSYLPNYNDTPFYIYKYFSPEQGATALTSKEKIDYTINQFKTFIEITIASKIISQIKEKLRIQSDPVESIEKSNYRTRFTTLIGRFNKGRFVPALATLRSWQSVDIISRSKRKFEPIEETDKAQLNKKACIEPEAI